MKNKIDRDRRTNLATGISLDVSDDGISKPEQRLSALDGESIRRDVPSNDNEEEYNGGKAYAEFLKLFFKGKNG